MWSKPRALCRVIRVLRVLERDLTRRVTTTPPHLETGGLRFHSDRYHRAATRALHFSHQCSDCLALSIATLRVLAPTATPCSHTAKCSAGLSFFSDSMLLSAHSDSARYTQPTKILAGPRAFRVHAPFTPISFAVLRPALPAWGPVILLLSFHIIFSPIILTSRVSFRPTHTREFRYIKIAFSRVLDESDTTRSRLLFEGLLPLATTQGPTARRVVFL